jgi:hypothetical protein
MKPVWTVRDSLGTGGKAKFKHAPKIGVPARCYESSLSFYASANLLAGLKPLELGTFNGITR